MYTLGLCFVCQPFYETKHRQISCRLQLKIARGPTLCMERNDALYSGLRSLKMLGSILGLLVGMSLSIVSHEIWWIHEGRFVSKIWQLGLRFHSSIENRIPSRVSVQDPESCTIKGQNVWSILRSLITIQLYASMHSYFWTQIHHRLRGNFYKASSTP